MTIHWVGGHQTQLVYARPVRVYSRRADRERLQARVLELRAQGQTAAQIAQQLNDDGFSSLRTGSTFNGCVVRTMLLKLGQHTERDDDALLGPQEWWIRDLADKLKTPWQTLREWAVNGWVHGRQSSVEKLWILWADREELVRLRKLRSASWRGILGKPSELTTPKPRPS